MLGVAEQVGQDAEFEVRVEGVQRLRRLVVPVQERHHRVVDQQPLHAAAPRLGEQQRPSRPRTGGRWPAAGRGRRRRRARRARPAAARRPSSTTSTAREFEAAVHGQLGRRRAGLVVAARTRSASTPPGRRAARRPRRRPGSRRRPGCSARRRRTRRRRRAAARSTVLPSCALSTIVLKPTARSARDRLARRRRGAAAGSGAACTCRSAISAAQSGQRGRSSCQLDPLQRPACVGEQPALHLAGGGVARQRGDPRDGGRAA